MSLHKKPLTKLEEEGLRGHGLDIGTASQLSDCFRHGVAWGLEAQQSIIKELEEKDDSELLQLIHDDLKMRSRKGVVDISDFIWQRLKQRLTPQNTNKEVD